MSQLPPCCRPVERKGKGFLQGLAYGLIPHTFCIAFILFTVLGVTAATSVLRQVLLVPYLLQICVALSLVFATLSAIVYLRRAGLLSAEGVRAKWRYLSILYGTAVAINLLLFVVIFPAAANIDVPRPGSRVLAQEPAVVASESGKGVSSRACSCGSSSGQGATAPSKSGQAAGAQTTLARTTLQVDIPCPGHAPLIKGELQQLEGVMAIGFQSPNLFQVEYDPSNVTLEQILALEVFQSYKATERS